MNLIDRALYVRRGGHVVSDPRCRVAIPLRPGTWRERRSRGIPCQHCRPGSGSR